MLRDRGRIGLVCVGLATGTAVAPAHAQSARDLLTQASFADADEASALRRVSSAYMAAANVLRRAPDDHEALLMRATALGYRAKLTGNRGDAIAARHQFEALVAQNPRNAEAQLALGAWHIGAVKKLGAIMGRAALGAQRGLGLSSLDQAIALGGDRALFSGLAALLRLELDPRDPRGRALAEATVRAGIVTPIDRILQRACVGVLASLRAGDLRKTRQLASQSLPFGRFDDDN
ncbi:MULTISPECIES: hypothetical protein [Sphingomonas]|jgi:hypothetical protein|uniref:Tetratricopeptide repeat protein n=1 Tax=Sphingomonas zeae TaxID=1646122 RepID=A0A7Y6B7Q5_9SPHN|nr:MULTISPECIES: hypothetical protein [Sphingomonas]MBB4046851.1 hypothetical protein [Sphingomonas zeae]MDK8184624.1 hypothetical protein [Sphingomonas zeae]MDK8214287.1 hypothetical protein [Sphingomonas sp. UMB7805-LC452B]NUU48956.1 hypothetical protein [Sphingomonas zeae]